MASIYEAILHYGLFLCILIIVIQESVHLALGRRAGVFGHHHDGRQGQGREAEEDGAPMGSAELALLAGAALLLQVLAAAALQLPRLLLVTYIPY